MTSLPGVSFDDCFDAKVQLDLDGIPVYFIDLDCLKENKRASGRPQDLADLDNLP